jgi:hypothetical protein
MPRRLRWERKMIKGQKKGRNRLRVSGTKEITPY